MSDEQRLNRRIYTREDLRQMGIKWCDSTMKRKIGLGLFPAPITPAGATRWWQVEAVDAALLDLRARGKTKLTLVPPSEAPKAAAQRGRSYPVERDQSLPGWVHVGQLWHEVTQCLDALQDCPRDDIAEAITEIARVVPGADVSLLVSALSLVAAEGR